MTKRKGLVGTGFAVGLDQLPNFTFKPDRPYRACLLCGRVYQSELDRRVNVGELPENSLLALRAKERRDSWAEEHAKQHTEKEHKELAVSGRTMTPEAATVLQAYGLIPISDMVMDVEMAAALAAGSSIPIQDAEA